MLRTTVLMMVLAACDAGEVEPVRHVEQCKDTIDRLWQPPPKPVQAPMLAAASDSCRATRWSAEVHRCAKAARSSEEKFRCFEKLAPAQRAAMDHAIGAAALKSFGELRDRACACRGNSACIDDAILDRARLEWPVLRLRQRDSTLEAAWLELHRKLEPCLERKYRFEVKD